MEKGDLEAALKVLKDRAQLLNLYPVKDQTPSTVQVNTVLPPLQRRQPGSAAADGSRPTRPGRS